MDSIKLQLDHAERNQGSLFFTTIQQKQVTLIYSRFSNFNFGTVGWTVKPLKYGTSLQDS